jgi:hypothetical protein
MTAEDTLCEAYVELSRFIADSPGLGPEDLGALGPCERAFVLALWGEQIVGNGGFQYFYEGATNALEVAGAMDEVGMPVWGEMFRRSVAVFPGGRPHEDQQERWAWMDEHSDLVTPIWEALEEGFYPAIPAFENILCEYLRVHADEMRLSDEVRRALQTN